MVDLNDLSSRKSSEVGEPSLRNPRAVTVIFRYAFIVDDEGAKVVDVTFPDRPVLSRRRRCRLLTPMIFMWPAPMRTLPLANKGGDR